MARVATATRAQNDDRATMMWLDWTRVFVFISDLLNSVSRVAVRAVATRDFRLSISYAVSVPNES